MYVRRFLGALALVAAFGATAAAQPSLNDILSRLDRYLAEYEQTLASVVAEERYSQTLSIIASLGKPEVIERRALVSDYALARSPGGQTWAGFRDTYEVDGKPVRGREARLAALLATGTAESSASARRIALENMRFNIGEEVAARNVNVPTMALDLVHKANRSRFSLRRSAGETIDGKTTWQLSFNERERPTIVRDDRGRDRPTRGSIWVDQTTGEVLKTSLEWDGEPRGFITVNYAFEPTINALVPVRMSEWYRRGNGLVDGEATYSNYRRFQATSRILQ